MDVSRYGQLKVFSRARSTSSASCSASAEGLSSRYWTTTQTAWLPVVFGGKQMRLGIRDSASAAVARIRPAQ